MLIAYEDESDVVDKRFFFVPFVSCILDDVGHLLILRFHFNALLSGDYFKVFHVVVADAEG